MEKDRKYEIYVKGGFSERKGIKHFNEIVQIDSLDERTRNKLYGITEDLLKKDKKEVELIEYIYTEIFSLTKTDIPIDGKEFNIFSGYYDNVKKDISYQFKTLDYNEIFDFIEGIIRGIRLETQRNRYIRQINQIFIDENVNYRIVKGIITDIIDKETIKEIEDTLNNQYKVVESHYSKAIELLYKSRDYDNSIKESITTVESMCQIITNNSKATLGDALKYLKDKIHPAMRSAFIKLYGYTSNTNGIRHANGLGEGNSTFEEARYMLISCSAFTNYLKENFEKSK